MTPSDSPPTLAKAVTSGPTVKATNPSAAPQNITLDVEITGTGFENGSTAKWLLNGAEDPKVKTNSTRFVSSTSVVANITIAADATPSLYDVAVITPLGKKGIGTEKFTVLAMQQLDAVGDAYARDVNSSGKIAGTTPGGCDSHALPVVWSNLVPQALPLYADYCSGRASQINDAGMILGYVNRAGATSHTTDIGVLWNPTPQGYSVQELGIANDGVRPWDFEGFNESGHVVANFGLAAPKAYWWSEETGFIRLLEPAGTGGCYAYDVNELDEIIGFCRTTPASSSELNQDAAYWSSPYSPPQLLPRLSGYNYVHPGHAINNNGVAAGEAWTQDRGGRLRVVGVTWTRSGSTWTIQQMPSLGGTETNIVEMNDAGWVTGRSLVTNGRYHAFLWRQGQPMRDLGAIGPESGAFGMTPSAAPELLVVGYSISGSVYRAVLWKPTL